jgi:hypothetical protein
MRAVFYFVNIPDECKELIMLNESEGICMNWPYKLDKGDVVHPSVFSKIKAFASVINVEYTDYMYVDMVVFRGDNRGVYQVVWLSFNGIDYNLRLQLHTLSLSVRARNCLKDYATLDEVAKKGFWGIIKLRNMGLKTMSEIERVLTQHNLWWSDRESDELIIRKPSVIDPDNRPKQMRCIYRYYGDKFVFGKVYDVVKWDKKGIPILKSEGGHKYRASLRKFEPSTISI